MKLEMHLADFLTGVQAVSMCASTDDARPILTGVFIERGDSEGTVRFTATDSYILGIVQVPALMVDIPDEGVIVKMAAIVKAAKQAKTKQGMARVTLASDGLTLTGTISTVEGSVTVAERLIEGTYPNMAQVIPTYAEETAQACSLGVTVTARVMKALACWIYPPNAPVALTVATGSRPVRWTAKNDGIDLTIYQMPVRPAK